MQGTALVNDFLVRENITLSIVNGHLQQIDETLYVRPISSLWKATQLAVGYFNLEFIQKGAQVLGRNTFLFRDLQGLFASHLSIFRLALNFFDNRFFIH
jgi:hypothetical protein